MTNREKFKEIFGYEANMNECPIYCHITDGDKCPCYKNKCYRGKWWNAEYKEPTTKNDLEVEKAIKIIKADNLEPYSVNDILAARDMAVYALKQMEITKNDLGVDCISRKAALDITWHDPSYSDPLNVLTEVRDKIRGLPSVTPQEPIHGKCNQCKHYEGVHNVQGHAPCSYHKIGGVVWNWYCSQFESEVENDKRRDTNTDHSTT